MREIGKEHNGTELDAQVGETLELRLPENPTTGYRWQLRSDGAPVLALLSDSFAPGGGATGSTGSRRWAFRIAQPGLARVAVEQQRNWERRAIDTFEVAVRARER